MNGLSDAGRRRAKRHIDVKKLSTFGVRRHAAVAVSLLVVAARASAGVGNAAANPVTGMEVLRMLLGLGVVLGLLLLGAWLFRRLAGQGVRRSGERLRVISSLGVGNRARILLVDVEGTRLLLGSGPQRVELIARIDGEAVSTEADAESNSFLTRLARQLGA